MKTTLLFLLLAFSSVSAEEKTEKTYIAAEFTHAGETYHDVKISLAAANEAKITHRGGIFRTDAGRLLPEVRTAIGYDVAAAAAADFPITLECLGAKAEGGKFRWFFTVTNKSKEPFLGSFKITMLNLTEPIESGREVFVSRGAPGIAPGAWTRVSLISHNGPESVHGDYGIGGFRCDLTDSEGELTGGAITKKITGKLLGK